jgi:hypothetical protein
LKPSPISRRKLLQCLIGSGVALGWGFRAGARPPRASALESLRAAAEFLIGAQKTDGTWRSSKHGFFREGDALTPVVLGALAGLPEEVQPREAIQRGRRWIAELTDDLRARREPWTALRYPLFTASYAARLCVMSSDQERAAFWTDMIEGFQVRDARGGWSDASVPPQPLAAPDMPDMWSPNLSATTCALEGLRAADRHEACKRALPFVASCQNFSGDGGFFFMPNDPIRNKAGASGVDHQGRRTFRSYGSATCDGVLSLLDCGVPVDAARVVAGIEWLRRHAGKDGQDHPGEWPPDRRDSGRALSFYYAHGFAEMLRRVATLSPGHQAWCRDMTNGLAQSLLKRQQADGSWVNDEPESFEDDPLLATALAMRTASLCDVIE